jgi:1,4-alpha-glucan branching enzyme
VPELFFSLVLHAHLPFVRHPELDESPEEDWLFEAVTEVYLPLLETLTRLTDEGLRPRLAISLSPTLCEMLADPFLRARYTRHLDNLLALAEKELARTFRDEPQSHAAARFYHRRHRLVERLWSETYRGDILAAFAGLRDAGSVELMTCAATHAVLPLVSTEEARRAQIGVAVANHRKHFGRAPRGTWLPECAYADDLESLLADAGLEFFVADSRAVLHGEPRPRYGVYAPVRLAAGIAAFARDPQTAEQVWSAEVGYPGDPAYREFYRDAGWDAPLEHLRPHLHADARRRPLGLKYHRVTGRDVRLSHKLPYDPEAAAARAREHARHFAASRVDQARRLRAPMGSRTPLVVSPYDAELFGHWWLEGPQFIEHVFRQIHERRTEIAAVTPGDYLDSGAPLRTQRLSPSTWGDGGYLKVWLGDSNAWMYPHLHAAETRMNALAARFADSPEAASRSRPTSDARPTDADEPPRGLTARALRQAARELMLAQSSDWAFQISQNTAPDYAARRFRSHLARFNALADGIERDAIREARLAEIERRDNLFSEIDTGLFRASPRPGSGGAGV